MNNYFNINYEFDKQTIWRSIDKQLRKEGWQHPSDGAQGFGIS